MLASNVAFMAITQYSITEGEEQEGRQLKLRGDRVRRAGGLCFKRSCSRQQVSLQLKSQGCTVAPFANLPNIGNTCRL